MKKLLFIYHSMIMGGSTTSLLALLKNLDKKKYNIDLQLYRTTGELVKEIPPEVNLLEDAELYAGPFGKIKKICKFIFSKYFLKYILLKIRRKKSAKNVLNNFLVKQLCKKNKNNYDVAIGFLEGWSDRYLAYNVVADKKYAWIHSTFSNVTKTPQNELEWMEKVDRIVFVAQSCADEFIRILPQLTKKAITIENLIDSSLIRQRSNCIDSNDKLLNKFISEKCFKIITVCRIVIDVKGLDRIVNCVKNLKAKGKNFIWYIVGDGKDFYKLKKLIKDNNIGDKLILVGTRLNPYPFIKASDIMCMPSRYEGKPMVITESQILEVPPVVTEYLSARMQIKDRIDGFVVHNNDTSIEEVLMKCMDDPCMVKNMKVYLQNNEYGNLKYISTIEDRLLLR